VLADAFYDFPATRDFEKDWERIRYNLREVRQVSLAARRHWILTAQFTTNARRSADEYSVGGTDAFNFISNTTIYLLQDQAERERRFVRIRVGKAREADAALKPWKHHWNFIEMNLDPVGIADPVKKKQKEVA
jgi:predicted secreted hydrolase